MITGATWRNISVSYPSVDYPYRERRLAAGRRGRRASPAALMFRLSRALEIRVYELVSAVIATLHGDYACALLVFLLIHSAAVVNWDYYSRRGSPALLATPSDATYGCEDRSWARTIFNVVELLRILHEVIIPWNSFVHSGLQWELKLMSECRNYWEFVIKTHS